MYALAVFYDDRDRQDYRFEKIEFLPSFSDACKRADELLNEFQEDFEIDYQENATERSPLTIAGNGDVTWRAYIKEIDDYIIPRAK